MKDELLPDWWSYPINWPARPLVEIGADHGRVTGLQLPRCPKGMISYKNDNGALLIAAGGHALALAATAPSPGRCADAMQGAGGSVDLKLGHYRKDGIEVIDVAGTIDIHT